MTKDPGPNTRAAPTPERLETDRLTLTRRSAAEASIYRQLWTERDPRVPAHRRIDASGRPTVQDIATEVGERHSDPEPGLLAVRRKLEGDVIGYCGLVFHGNGMPDEPELAFELLRETHGLGYATEAGEAVLAWAAEAGHTRVWATVRDWNHASRGVLAKLGFHETGQVEVDADHGDSILTVRPRQMDDLPVPPLHHTLETYLGAVRPLLTDGQWRDTRAAAEQTLMGEGPACQRDLEVFAATEAADGRSWLSQAWLRGYLEVRAPLPLTSNVGFQIHPLPESQHVGIPRAAAVIRRLAGVHLAWLRGELPPEQTPRGQPVSGQQREVLAGGLRRPGPDVDEVCPGSTDPSVREIAVLIDDQVYAVPISDTNGRPMPLPEVEASLHAAIELRGPSTSEQAHQPLTRGFTALSYLGSAQASGYLDQLLIEPPNQRVYDRLQNALFVVNLLREPATDREHLMRTAFGIGQAWAYSPISYQVSLVDDFDGMHLEHSRVDAATLQTVLAHLDDVDDVAQDPTDLASSSAADPRARALAEPLGWRLPEALAEDLDEGLRAYRQQADQLRVEIARVPMPAPGDLSFPVSDDAVCQWLLLYAQLAAYGRVRSVYEAVDMRHVVAGRTECLRPVTPEAVTLVRALLSGQARPEHLHAGLAAHKAWVKACKTGNGIDRHLLMLSQTAAQRSTVLPVFEDLGWARLSTDLLSTTSLGSHHPVGRLTFAPTSPGGIGINYTPVGDEYEFVISWVDGEATEVESFPEHLARGARALAVVVQEAAETAPTTGGTATP